MFSRIVSADQMENIRRGGGDFYNVRGIEILYAPLVLVYEPCKEMWQMEYGRMFPSQLTCCFLVNAKLLHRQIFMD